MAAGTQPAVALDDRGRWVARVHTASGDVAVKAVDGTGSLAREVAAVATLVTAGVPVAPVLADLGGDPHVIVSAWAPGVPLSSKMAWGAHAAAGALLARLHAAPCPQPHVGWVIDRAAAVLDWWDPHAPGAAVTAVRDQLPRLRASVGVVPGTWGLFDARPDHMLVSPGSVTLIDVEHLASFDPAMDLATCAAFDPNLLPGLLAGYETSPHRRRHVGSTIPAWVVLRALAAARWRDEHGFDTTAIPALLSLAGNVDASRPVEAGGQLPLR